ncbi:hypothetical protein AMAG_11904 [Allomyces macrogynus ATCC 38327]|uniref:PIH1 N-terminal domain-containing protein n=1 Tax=Allomyces macrogynus (strain ATCC 38327) TaxID=578462 RepID=A0A0L0SY13_ALLM3|nr:hypothetical protein AMAG_11904 [Allomyces macrogynus ATCC 38327]|eukprot:KNE67443.1 hypothetical protein AMAG_11904 [Allomyces macrogynus ATCC 38327]
MNAAQFPTGLLKNADEDTKRRALEFWNQLNMLAAKDPAAYRKKLTDTMAAAQAAESDAPAPLLTHAQTLKAKDQTSTAYGYVNVLASDRIRPMVGTEIPMMISRLRILEDESAKPFVIDVVVHPDVVEKAAKEDEFRADLRALIWDSIRSTHSLIPIVAPTWSKLDSYKGPWLWNNDGMQKTALELRDAAGAAGLTPMSVLDKLGHAHAGAAPDETETESDFQLQLPTNAPSGKHPPGSKATLIQELTPAGRLAGAQAPIDSLAPVPPAQPASSPKSAESAHVDDKVAQFLASIPPRARRTAYQSSGSTRVLAFPLADVARFARFLLVPVRFGLRLIFKLHVQIAEWNYSAELLPDARVLHFVPQLSTLPILSVRLFPEGGQLLVGPKVVHAQKDWQGMVDFPTDFAIGFSKKSKTLSVTLRS